MLFCTVYWNSCESLCSMKYNGTILIGFGSEKHNCTQNIYSLLPKFIKQGQKLLHTSQSRKPNADLRSNQKGISKRSMQFLKRWSEFSLASKVSTGKRGTAKLQMSQFLSSSNTNCQHLEQFPVLPISTFACIYMLYFQRWC